MITLGNYIGSIYEAQQESASPEERMQQLKTWLKDKNYPDYVATLNRMLKDDKARVLLQDGFGGELGNIKFKFQPRLIRTASLIPTQSEIDVEQSLTRALKNVTNINNIFKDTVVVGGVPIVTFRGNYIIDGHHRWAEVAMVNPDGKMLCFDYDADISPIQMLKAVQGAIAAVCAKQSRKLPSSEVNAQNIYDKNWTPDKMRKYISDTVTDSVIKELQKHYPECNTKDSVVDMLVENIVSFKVNNPPVYNAQERTVMPQAAKAGTKAGDKSTALPDSSGSALNKLRDGKFEKDIL